MAATLVTTGLSQEVGVRYTYITDVEADWTSVPISTYFYDLETKLPYYKDSSSVVISIFESGGSDSLYTADGTITGDRTVDLNNNDLIIENSGTSSNFQISTSGSSYSLFNRSGGLKIRPDTLDPIVVTNTGDTLDTFTLKKNGGGSWSAYNGVKIGELTTNDFAQFTIDDLSFYKANVIQHKIGFGRSYCPVTWHMPKAKHMIVEQHKLS